MARKVALNLQSWVPISFTLMLFDLNMIESHPCLVVLYEKLNRLELGSIVSGDELLVELVLTPV